MKLGAALAVLAVTVFPTLLLPASLAQPVNLVASFNVAEIQEHVKALASLGSRFTGYAGYYKALEYVNLTLVSIGLKPIFLPFNATVPLDHGALVRVGNTTVKAFHLYPNLVALCAANSVSGQLVYVGRRSLAELTQLDLSGKIAVLEFDGDWSAALARGAKALIFLGPVSGRESAMKKISIAPIDVPRVYVGEGADVLREAAKAGLQAVVEGEYGWERVRAYNILAEIRGYSEPEKVIVLAARIDSGSIVPALAPGAEEAVNVALLLHIARLLAESRPKYTVWIALLSGHWQGLAGARWFVEQVMFSGKVGSLIFPYIVLNFDISSGDSKLAVYPGGFFYGHRTQGAMNLYADFRSSLVRIVKEFYERYRDDYKAIESEAMRYNATTGIVLLRSFDPGYAISYSQPFYLDSEPFQLAKIPAITFLTFQDPRRHVFTPNDTPDRVDWKNIEPQARFALFVLEKVLNDISVAYSGSWDSIRPRRTEIDPVNGGFGYLAASVEVLEYDPTVPTLYKPVPNSIVVVQKRDWYYNVMGSLAVTTYDPPFAKIIELADESGRAEIVGLAPPEIFIGNIEVYAYKVEGGRLTYVPDMGPNGLARFLPYPPKLSMGTVLKAVAFRAAALLLPLVSIPDRPWPLATLNIYGKPVYSLPYTRYVSPHPVSISIFLPNLAVPDSYYYAVDPINRFVILFAPPLSDICAVVKLGGEERKSVILLNSTAGVIEGYRLGDPGSIRVVPDAPRSYVGELIALAKDRYDKALVGGVTDPTTSELLEIVGRGLGQETLGSVWAAWSASLMLYERTYGMTLDFAMSTLVVMVLAAPFSILVEKLLVGKGGMRRLVSIVLSALLTFAVFSLLHPGFTIVYSAYALSLGVLMIALSVPSFLFLALLFKRALGQVRKAQLGVHELEREAFDLLVTAMSTGVENMRRRPLRTALTLTTIILVVTSLVALTSVVPVLRISASSYRSSAAFTGILIKSPSNEPLDPVLVELLKGIVGEGYEIAPRYWLYPPREYFTLSGKGGTTSFAVIVGVSPAELNASLRGLGLDPVIFSSVAGSCLLPKTLASALGVDIGDAVHFAGYELLVAGVFDDSLAERAAADIVDRVGETPYGGRPYDVEKILEVQRFDESFRVPWSGIVIINSELAKDMPGSFLHSVLLVPKTKVDEEQLVSTAKEIFRVFSGLEVYVSHEGNALLISSRYVQEFFGFSFMVVPMLIAGMVLMTSVLGSIHERVREASIYSALGLAPAHVGGMFLAEVIVYAVLGIVMGYVAGIAMARFTNFAALTGGTIGMNYSSSSVLFSLMLITALVLLSASYPISKVSKLVTPSLERKWRIPTKAKGDVWEVLLPFTFRERREVVGVIAYLCEYFENRRERMGTFAITSYSPYSEPNKVGLRAKVWLAPFEQNIVQEANFSVVRSTTEARYMSFLTARRESGPYEIWLKSCETFIREVRSQLLTWRLLFPEERENYIRRGMELVGAG